jgi:hypothetical protein
MAQEQVTVVVSIGSGIGRGPRKGQQQSAAEFDLFVRDVRRALYSVDGPNEQGFAEIYVDAARSFGTDELGAPEGSATWVAAVFASDYSLGYLRTNLEHAAWKNAQRCIALTVGGTEFVGPGAE